jgi:hypothetical protein
MRPRSQQSHPSLQTIFANSSRQPLAFRSFAGDEQFEPGNWRIASIVR